MNLIENKHARIAFFILVAGFSAGLGLLSVIFYQVWFGDDSELQQSTIMARINEETIIYYDDESTPIGSFFENSHRQYVPIQDVPAHMINAIIAAEDKNFYTHSGIDFIALTKAFLEGVKAGFHFRRGGSTITQQTVKNIMGRWERTFQRKFREIISAMQLERIYSKRQILEFYLNQFHVAHNGNGIGIAARYYFDKEVNELDLVESAFIAGSVKAPNKYNPFTKNSKKSRQIAIDAANERKNYVLGRMYQQGWIIEEEYKDAVEIDVPFKKGKFRSQEVSNVQLIRKELDDPRLLESVGVEAVEDLNRAGLKIFTTLSSEAQEVGQLVMRRRLSAIETILSGFKEEDPKKYKPKRYLEVNNFYYGKVVKVHEGKTPYIEMNFGLPSGVIPFESVVRYSKLLDLADGIGSAAHVKDLLKSIQAGDVLYVEVLEYDRKKSQAVLELHKRPSVNGGLIAIDEGNIKALIPGFDTQGFNRAWQAKRPPGSVFKSVLYFAAFQMGWNVLDRLDNERQIFPYQKDFYMPKGDHESPYPEVSILWSGIKSENIASVALAYRLLEKINFRQFKYVLDLLGLSPQSGETEGKYSFRLEKELGVHLDSVGISEFQLLQVLRYEVEPDLVFSGSKSLKSWLMKMWWGRNYLKGLQDIKQLPDKDYSTKEKFFRSNLVKNNFVRMRRLEKDLQQDWFYLQQKVNEIGHEMLMQDPASLKILKRFRILAGQNAQPALAYYREYENEFHVENIEHTNSPAFYPMSGRRLGVYDIDIIWGGGKAYSSNFESTIQIADVLLEGYLPNKLFSRIKYSVNERQQRILARRDPYRLNHYFQNRDFRIALGLNYLVSLVKLMGVESPVEPVLSFPLGTNDVTAAEVALIYQALITGKLFTADPEKRSSLNIVKRIEDRTGQVLYEPTVVTESIGTENAINQIRLVLRKIVTHGTGRRAGSELYLNLDQKDGENQVKIKIPSYGKTGTTNDFTTSYYAGALPYPTGEGGSRLDPENSLVVSAYVGYDLNKTMRKGRFRVYGSSGGLPLWTDFCKEMIDIYEYPKFVDQFDIGVLSSKTWKLKSDPNNKRIYVDLPRGILLGRKNERESEETGVTNYALTGEEYVNEFAVGSRIRSSIYLSLNDSQNPLREFSLYPPMASSPNNIKTSLSIIEPQSEAQKIDDEPVPDASRVDESSNTPMPTNVPESGNVDQRGVSQGSGERIEREDVRTKIDSIREKAGQIIRDSRREPDPAKRKETNDQEDSFVEEDLW